MRPQQKTGRSRGNKNRGKGGGGGGGGYSHSPSRVYESAGPEGKVRGTPQQIIDKYLGLARDSQLSGDRVTAENFLQHAEHYARILISVQESQNGEHRPDAQQPGYYDGDDREDEDPRFARDPRDGGDQPRFEPQPQQQRPQPQQQRPQPQPQQQRPQAQQAEPPQRQPQAEAREEQPAPRDEQAVPRPDPAPRTEPEAETALPAFITAPAIVAAEGGPDIVETPESRAKPVERRPRRPRAKPAKPEGAPAPEAAE